MSANSGNPDGSEQLRSRRLARLPQDIRDVIFDVLHGTTETLGYLAIGFPAKYVIEHALLAGCEQKSFCNLSRHVCFHLPSAIGQAQDREEQLSYRAPPLTDPANFADFTGKHEGPLVGYVQGAVRSDQSTGRGSQAESGQERQLPKPREQSTTPLV